MAFHFVKAHAPAKVKCVEMIIPKSKAYYYALKTHMQYHQIQSKRADRIIFNFALPYELPRPRMFSSIV